MPDYEIGLNEGRLRRLVYTRRRSSDAGTVANGGIVPLEAISGTEVGVESKVTGDGQPGRPLHRSLEPVAAPRSPDEHVVGREDEPPAQLAPETLTADGGSSQDENRRQEWCAIVFAGAKRQGEFRVVAVDDGGQRQVIARSSPFRASHLGSISRRGGAKEAHNLLVKRLLALGWREVASRGRWYDAAFTKTAPDGDPVERLLIICGHDRLVGRFKAARFDDLYNATIVGESAPFGALHIRGSMKLGPGARKAHGALLDHLRADGWQTTGKAGGEWYAVLLARSTELPFPGNDRPRAGSATLS